MITNLRMELFQALYHTPISAYLPYCSSDCYTGTRDPGLLTEGRAFYGHHIVRAVLADLLENTWLPQAEEASVQLSIIDLDLNVTIQ